MKIQRKGGTHWKAASAQPEKFCYHLIFIAFCMIMPLCGNLFGGFIEYYSPDDLTLPIIILRRVSSFLLSGIAIILAYWGTVWLWKKRLQPKNWTLLLHVVLQTLFFAVLFAPLCFFTSIIYGYIFYGRWRYILGTELFIFLFFTAWVAFTFILKSWIQTLWNMQAEHERALQQELVAERLRTEALLRRVEPHFLFNSLNSIKALALEERLGEIPIVVEKLAEIYRLLLESPIEQLIPLAQEISLVTQYLAIEKVRFEERLNYQVEVDSDVAADSVAIPPLVILSLVENAIKHGISQNINGGTITIAVRWELNQKERWLTFTVENSGKLSTCCRIEATEGRPGGTALVRRRLELLGEGMATLELLAPKSGWVLAVIKIQDKICCINEVGK